MKEETQEQFFDDLMEILIHHLGYYVPKILIPNAVFEELKNKIEIGLFDELSVLDIHYGIGNLDVLEFNLLQQKKKNLLERNIFKLLKKKNTLEEFEVIFILEKYWNQLTFYVYLTKLLKDNFTKYNKKQLTVLGSFEMQYEIFYNHLKEFKQRFGYLSDFKEKEDFSTNEIVKNKIQDLIARFGLATEKYDESSKNYEHENIERITAVTFELSNEIPTEINKTKKEEKLKKEPLLTEKEIEDFLLESVFHVKLKN